MLNFLALVLFTCCCFLGGNGSGENAFIDEYFTITQVVSDGDWVDSSKNVTIKEKLITTAQETTNSGTFDVYANKYISQGDGTYSTNNTFTSKREYNQTGLVSLEWSMDRTFNTSGTSYDPYGSYSGTTSLSETVSSTGEAEGEYLRTSTNSNTGRTVTEATRDSSGIYGTQQTFNSSGTLTSTVVITTSNAVNFTNFYRGGDQSTRTGSTVFTSLADPPPPPPVALEKPAVPSATDYVRPTTA